MIRFTVSTHNNYSFLAVCFPRHRNNRVPQACDLPRHGTKTERSFKYAQCIIYQSINQMCSHGSVVEHCVSSAKVVGSTPREHTY